MKCRGDFKLYNVTQIHSDWILLGFFRCLPEPLVTVLRPYGQLRGKGISCFPVSTKSAFSDHISFRLEIVFVFFFFFFLDLIPNFDLSPEMLISFCFPVWNSDQIILRTEQQLGSKRSHGNRPFLGILTPRTHPAMPPTTHTHTPGRCSLLSLTRAGLHASPRTPAPPHLSAAVPRPLLRSKWPRCQPRPRRCLPPVAKEPLLPWEAGGRMRAVVEVPGCSGRCCRHICPESSELVAAEPPRPIGFHPPRTLPDAAPPAGHGRSGGPRLSG